MNLSDIILKSFSEAGGLYFELEWAESAASPHKLLHAMRHKDSKLKNIYFAFVVL